MCAGRRINDKEPEKATAFISQFQIELTKCSTNYLFQTYDKSVKQSHLLPLVSNVNINTSAFKRTHSKRETARGRERDTDKHTTVKHKYESNEIHVS